VRSAWACLIAGSSGYDPLEQSPEYFDHLRGTHDASRLHLATVRGAGGAIAGVVPLRVASSSLKFEWSGHVVARSRARELRVLGSVPLLPADPLLHDSLFAALDIGFEDCPVIAMRSVPAESFLWRYIHESRYIQENLLVYIMYGVRGCHTMRLPPTMGAYWAKFDAKRRYNLKRQAKLLRERFGGLLELRRFDSPDQIEDLIDLITPAGGFAGLKNWNGETVAIDRRQAESLADRGLLLIYLVIGAGRPCAAMMGMKYRGVYYVESIPRDRSLDRFSPGVTAVQLSIEDLLHQTSIRKIDMGYGEPAYRHHSTNAVEPRACLLLFRKTLANRVLRRNHAMFESAVNLAKACIGRSSRPDLPESVPPSGAAVSHGRVDLVASGEEARPEASGSIDISRGSRVPSRIGSSNDPGRG
jgi:hypothetical protein